MKSYEIEASNVFYVSNFNVIGGVETFIFELCRKYKDYDITVIYKTGHQNQITRLMKYVRVIKYTGQHIKCKHFFCNYETDIVDNVDAEEYTQIIHAMFITNKLHPRIHPKINRYLAVSETAAKEWEELTGNKAKVCRNPLQVPEEEKKPILELISATRLTPEKGKDRMIKLGQELNKKGIEYIWYIFTNDTEAIDNPNIVYCKPRLNIRPILASINGYGVQLSDCEGDCYFTRECEALGIPLIVTPISSFKEQGLIEGVNCYYMPFDMVDMNVERLLKIPKYKGYLGEDKWEDELIKTKSTYKEGNMKAKLKCIRSYWDIYESDKRVKDGKDGNLPVGYEWVVDRKRAEELLNNPNNLVELVDWIEEQPKKEDKKLPTKKVTKRK